jgi:hypothetical protein
MKLLSRDSEKLVWQLHPRERDLLHELMLLHGSFDRQAPTLSQTGRSELARAQRDLETDLQEHRQLTGARVAGWFAEEGRCQAQTDGSFLLATSPAEAETLLQVIGSLRVAAWESLGRPNPPDPPEPEHIRVQDHAAWWALAISGALTQFLVMELSDGDIGGTDDDPSAPPTEPD